MVVDLAVGQSAQSIACDGDPMKPNYKRHRGPSRLIEEFAVLVACNSVFPLTLAPLGEIRHPVISDMSWVWITQVTITPSTDTKCHLGSYLLAEAP